MIWNAMEACYCFNYSTLCTPPNTIAQTPPGEMVSTLVYPCRYSGGEGKFTVGCDNS
jgi:hypothetical protein